MLQLAYGTSGNLLLFAALGRHPAARLPAVQLEPFLEDGLRRMTPNPSIFEKAIADKLLYYKEYIVMHGQDMPESRDWKWKPAHE